MNRQQATRLHALGVAAALALGPALLHNAAAQQAQTSPTAPAAPQPPAQRATAQKTPGVAVADQRMMRDLAQANLAEIETGRLAQEKAGSEEVKRFGSQMVEDHQKALSELQELARGKNVELPTEPDAKHKLVATGLKALSGEAFDKQYIRMVGVTDHRQTVEKLQRVQRETGDNDLRAYAAKTLPVVQKHLQHAEGLHGAQARK
ncbi:MAG: DUF4142 domain-containing protein [Pseudacidovorax sp.]|nr:DUF4142 domain-containing protein [Pseudacidovorax sp.]